MNYEKGSEWRKWDLHVHSPMSHNYRGTWEQFIIQIKNAECDVIGINDYFSVSGYKKLISDGGLVSSNKIFFPVVEMRMTDVVKNRHNSGTRHFNFHLIFNNDQKVLAVEDIENFIKGLKYLDSTISERYNDRNELKDIKVSFDGTIRALEEDSKFKDNYLIWLPYDEYGGIDDIDPNSDGLLKKQFIKKSDILGSSNKNQIDFFLWESPPDKDNKLKVSQENFKEWFEDKKPCIKGSDSHDYKHPIGKLKNKESKPIDKFCWIKSDPTFEGLKQIVYEPEERVYIGEKPPLLDRVENNKTEYIKYLKINCADKSNISGNWFENVEISFGKELVAIIGNKGSGKSGVADMLGLVGNSHRDEKHFSFLSKNKFRKGKLAAKYKAQIIWESGGKSDEINLNENAKPETPESVRFIPQNYFEELANEIEISKFQQVLESIIFSYIPKHERLGKSTFAELREYKSQGIDKDIQYQKNKIEEINGEIIELEEKKDSSYLKAIKGHIEAKEIQINAQKELLKELPNIPTPSKNKSINIEQHNTELVKLQTQLKEKETVKSNITSKIESLNQLKEKIAQQKQYFDEFIQNNSMEAKKYGLDIRKILKIEINYSSINDSIKKAESELVAINNYLESDEEKNIQSDDSSIVLKIKKLNEKIAIERNKLTGKEKEFQVNEQWKREINAKIKELTGDTNSPENETLNYYKKEEELVKNVLPERLQERRDERLNFSLDICSKKNKIIKFYNSFKQSVDDKISENKDLLGDYDIEIDSSFSMSPTFLDEFIGYINLGKRGHFRGKEEGEENIKNIVRDSDFDKENNIKYFLENIIKNLENGEAEIKDQIKTNKLKNFYDYVFSLDYINPEYELKLGGKSLSQLSPGERGALLLIFYLMIDTQEIPLVIDQPEDNLDNESVYNMLSKFILQAKKKRQIIMVTHNPNLAVGADAEQIIHVKINKANKNKFSFMSGSIENPEINKKIVRILEGTKPAFDKRRLKYQEK